MCGNVVKKIELEKKLSQLQVRSFKLYIKSYYTALLATITIMGYNTQHQKVKRKKGKKEIKVEEFP